MNSEKAADYQLLKRICASRSSVRSFSNKQVDRELIDQILHIGYTSPYASGKKNWEIVVVDQNSLIKKVAAEVETGTAAYVESMREDFVDYFEQYSRNFSFFKDAPVLLIPVFRFQRSISLMVDQVDPFIEQWERDNQIKSISCVAMLILLAAESLGLSACYMTGPLLCEEGIKKHIPIKKGRSVGAIIPLGYGVENKGEEDGNR